MPFCNKCGVELGGGAAFCPQCGSRNTGGVAAARPQMTAPPAEAPARRGWGVGAKIALGVGIAIVVVILALVAVGAYFAAHVRQVRTADGRTEVVTPFGNVGTGQPSDQAARQLGIAVYPGARPERSARVDFGGFHADVLRFRTPDSPAQVIAFYRKQYASAAIQNADRNSLAVVDRGLQLNIDAHRDGDETEFDIRQSRQ